jgi:hypothetical protein
VKIELGDMTNELLIEYSLTYSKGVSKLCVRELCRRLEREIELSESYLNIINDIINSSREIVRKQARTIPKYRNSP